MAPPDPNASPGAGAPRAPARGGRSGRRKLPENAAVILDRLLLRSREMRLNGEKTQLPTINVVLLQLLQKEMAGDRRARHVLLKYREFAGRGAAQKLELRFADKNYASQPSEVKNV